MNHRDNKNHTAWVKTFTEYRRPGAIKQIAEPVPLSITPSDLGECALCV